MQDFIDLLGKERGSIKCRPSNRILFVINAVFNEFIVRFMNTLHNLLDVVIDFGIISLNRSLDKLNALRWITRTLRVNHTSRTKSNYFEISINTINEISFLIESYRTNHEFVNIEGYGVSFEPLALS